MPGPEPEKDSVKSNSVKKAFYIKEDNWRKIESYAGQSGQSKSLMINEALQLYFTNLYGERNHNFHQEYWTVVSLFSGCGGMDIGFEGGFNYLGKLYSRNRDNASIPETKKYFKVIFANDLLPEACSEYRNYFTMRGNIPLIHTGDIAQFLDQMELMPKQKRNEFFPVSCDVLIGGFPCQDFSVAGKRKGLTTNRGKLYLQMKRAINMTNPKIFIAENVKGLTNLGEALEKITKDFSQTGKYGYKILHKLHMAADFGVPQTRERVFICGIRKDLDFTKFDFPLETHSLDDQDTGLNAWVTSKEAIDDLLRKDIDNQNQYSKAKNYGAHLQGNKPIRADYPSPTIRAEHHGNIEFHYSQSRRLTIRECARLQSFPDDFEFLCSPSKAYRLIGNAVPPVLAWHIADSVAQSLYKWENINLYTGKSIEPKELQFS